MFLTTANEWLGTYEMYKLNVSLETYDAHILC